MKINKKYVGLTALLTATTAASVFAAGATNTQTINVADKASGNRMHHSETEAQQKEHQTAVVTSLAKALGTTVEVITAKLDAGISPRDIIKASGLDETTIKAQLDVSREADMKARLLADVTSGKITQAQADEMIAHKDDHEGKGGGGKGGEGMLVSVATILGTTKEVLQTQMNAGKNLKDIVTASGISETDFRSKMDTLRQTEMKTKLHSEVTSGKMTQVEADKKLATMKNHKEDGQGEKGARGFGGKHGMSKGSETKNATTSQ
jgi:putative ubiquitin-RnfH superfamily antitoxin RatB of RatAB toxin-antitoxin module